MKKPAAPHHVAFFLKAMGGGGAERTTARVAAALAERGHRVDLVLARARGPMLGDLPASVRLVDLRAGPGVAALPTLLRLPAGARSLLPSAVLRNRPRVLAALPGLSRYLRRERPDALVSAMEWNNLVAIWAHQLAGVDTALVVCEHTTLSERIRDSKRPHIRRLPGLVSRFYPHADAVAAVSDGAAADLARTVGLARERVATLYNPVDLERVRELSRAPLDDPWLAPGQPPLVLAVGRLKSEKDYPTLLRAFARARARRPLRLLVLGEGGDRAELERLVRQLELDEAVRLPGFARNPYAYMARAGVLVLSSSWEGLGNVLTEALACGCPVVSTDCPNGPREILEGGRYGTLVPVGDDAALADAILETLAAPPAPERMRAGAERFSIERCVEAYLRVLTAALSSRVSPPRERA